MLPSRLMEGARLKCYVYSRIQLLEINISLVDALDQESACVNFTSSDEHRWLLDKNFQERLHVTIDPLTRATLKLISSCTDR